MLRMTNPGPTPAKASRGPEAAGKTLTSRVTRSHGRRSRRTSGLPRRSSRGLRGTRSTWTSRTPLGIDGRPRSSPPGRRAGRTRTRPGSVTTPITRGSSTWARGSRSGPAPPVRRQPRRPSPPISVSRSPSRPILISRSRSLAAGGAGVATPDLPHRTTATRGLSRRTAVRRVRAGPVADRGTPGTGTPARARPARPGSRPQMTAPPGAAEPAELVRGTPGASGLTRIPVCPAGLTRDLTPRGSPVPGLPRPGSPIRIPPRQRSLVPHLGLLTRDRPRPRSRTRTRRRLTPIPDTDSTRASLASQHPGLARRGSPSRGSPSRGTARRPRPSARGMAGTGAVAMKRSAWLNPLIRDSHRLGLPIRSSGRMAQPTRSSPRPA